MQYAAASGVKFTVLVVEPQRAVTQPASALMQLTIILLPSMVKGTATPSISTLVGALVVEVPKVLPPMYHREGPEQPEGAELTVGTAGMQLERDTKLIVLPGGTLNYTADGIAFAEGAGIQAEPGGAVHIENKILAEELGFK